MKFSKVAAFVAAAFATGLTEVKSARSQYDAKVQELAVQAIAQSWEHRNITPAMGLIEAVGKHDKAALVAYFEAHGQMKWDTKSGDLKFLDRSKMFTGSEEEQAKAFGEFEDKVLATRWTDAKKPVEPKSIYDAQTEIGNLIDRLLKKASKGATIKNKAVLMDVHAAYCASIAKHYGEQAEMPQGQQPAQANVAGVVQADRVNELAAAARNKEIAEQVVAGLDPEKVAALQQHFGKAPELKVANG